MEQLCIRSFLYHGHEFHLYAYEPPAGLPEGVILQNAAVIVQPSKVFKYADRDTYSGFSNLFRYKLLLEKGGFWVDMDMVCLAPIVFSQAHLFAEQFPGELASCIIKAPAGSQVMAKCYQYAAGRDRKALYWGETGPRLLQAAVEHSGLLDEALPSQVFCPIPYPQHDVFTQAGSAARYADQIKPALAVHLWNELWRKQNKDKNGQYADSSLYEYFKRCYL